MPWGLNMSILALIDTYPGYTTYMYMTLYKYKWHTCMFVWKLLHTYMYTCAYAHMWSPWNLI